MQDIIVRLQENESANVLTNEAAEEIFRLRRVILKLHDQRATLLEQVHRDGKTVDFAARLIVQIKKMCKAA